MARNVGNTLFFPCCISCLFFSFSPYEEFSFSISDKAQFFLAFCDRRYDLYVAIYLWLNPFRLIMPWRWWLSQNMMTTETALVELPKIEFPFKIASKLKFISVLKLHSNFFPIKLHVSKESFSFFSFLSGFRLIDVWIDIGVARKWTCC